MSNQNNDNIAIDINYSDFGIVQPEYGLRFTNPETEYTSRFQSAIDHDRLRNYQAFRSSTYVDEQYNEHLQFIENIQAEQLHLRMITDFDKRLIEPLPLPEIVSVFESRNENRLKILLG